MYTCPSCNKATITAKEKFKAKRSNPVTCSECNHFSSVSGNIEGINIILYQALFYAGLITSFYYWSLIPIAILIVFAVAYEVLILQYSPLIEVSKKEIQKINSLYNWGLAVLFLLLS